ncbi:MAG: MATE family efflux transporter [Candidatus Zixiibacteriota bacterium]
MNKDILKLAIPSIITNVSVPLLSSVDTALVGHLEHQFYLGGAAIGAMIFNFIFWAFGFLRMGTTGLTAQAFGEGNQRECGLILSRAVLVALLAAGALITLQYVIKWAAFQTVTASNEVEEQAAIYYNIRIWSAPAALFIYAIQGWFLGMQNARYPMVIAIFINCVTIGLDVFFLQVLHMKVAGVALGTLIAQYCGVMLALILFYIKYREYANGVARKQILELVALKKFFAVNRDIFLRTMLLIATYTFFTAKSAGYGDTVLSANTILMQLWMIMAYGIDGFAFAAESLVGRFVGSRDLPNLKKTVRLIFVWAIGLGLSVSLGYLLFGEKIVRLFTDNETVVATAMAFFIWTIIAPLVNGVCFVWDGVFIGATATKAMLISMGVATLAFYFPVYYLAEPSLGNHALWLAMIAYMAVRGVTLTFYAPGAIFRRIA